MSLKGQKTTTTAIEWEDFKSLIGKLERDGEYKYCLLISVGVFTGLRISDILTLRYEDILENEILTLTEKKTKKQRRIRINTDLRVLVSRIMNKTEVTDHSQLLFLNRFGTKAIDSSWANQNLKRIFKKYGIQVEGNISSHMFRKTLGNRVLKLNNYSDKSMLLLMELFGHSSFSITKKYLGIKEREVLSVYDSLRL